MKMSKAEYAEYVKNRSPKSPLGKDLLLSFLVGGSICCLGQALVKLYGALGFSAEDAGTWSSVTLVFLSALFTGLGLYRKLAQHAGAGTLVPITGFANAVSAPAVEFKSEGFILGVGAKMFTIAGPVIVYGVVASVVYGVIYWLTTLF